MHTSNRKVYLIFMVSFLVMHFTGVVVSEQKYIFNALITVVVVIGALVMLIYITDRARRIDIFRNIGFRRTSLRSLQPGIILAAVLLLMYPLMHFVFHIHIKASDDWLLNMAGLFLTGGITEETLFRGYLFGTLRKQWTFRKAVLVSTFFFAMAHLLLFTYMDSSLALISTLLAITGSLPFAYLYEKGNFTIWSPALVHATIRTVGMVVTTGEQDYTSFSMLWISGCIILPYVVLLFYKDFRAILKNHLRT